MEKTEELTALLDNLGKIAADTMEVAKLISDASQKTLDIVSALKSAPETAEEPKPKKKKEPAPKETPEPAPKEEKIDKAEVRKILAAAADKHRAEVKALLTKYGADNLTQLAPEHYAAIIADAEELVDA